MNATFKSKSLILLLGAALLGSVSATASAQSREYQRGYDAGYREGLEAARNGGGHRGGGIVIDDASYGIQGGPRCDARRTVQAAVSGRNNVEILVNNDLCGDPAQNRVKMLSVRYRCEDGRALRLDVREGDVAQISCRR